MLIHQINTRQILNNFVVSVATVSKLNLDLRYIAIAATLIRTISITRCRKQEVKLYCYIEFEFY